VAKLDNAAKYKRELKALAQGIQLKVVVLPDFKKHSYRPVIVRQERTYSPSTGSLQPIGKFLVQRGMVEILSQEQTLHLFREMHWCGYQIQKLSRKRYSNDEELHKGVIKARKMVSEIEAAEEELFMANRRLIVSCTKPYFWIGQVWLTDFMQEGSKALTNAARKFDFTRGTPFFSYAQTAIRNRLRNYFRDHVRSGSIGIRPTREMIAIKHILDEWKEKNKGKPDPAVIAKLTGLTEAQISKTLPIIRQWETLPSPPVSLDATITGDNTTNLYQFIEGESGDAASDAAQRSEIWSAVQQLAPRARYIMQLRYLEGRTLEETGKRLGLTRARIKQIQDESLKKLRQILGRAGPRY
jgi:RNA polymerase primary sigma factor